MRLKGGCPFCDSKMEVRVGLTPGDNPEQTLVMFECLSMARETPEGVAYTRRPSGCAPRANAEKLLDALTCIMTVARMVRKEQLSTEELLKTIERLTE